MNLLDREPFSVVPLAVHPEVPLSLDDPLCRDNEGQRRDNGNQSMTLENMPSDLGIVDKGTTRDNESGLPDTSKTRARMYVQGAVNKSVVPVVPQRREGALS